MSINITQKAAKQISKLLTKHANSIGLRIYIDNSGCAGFVYKLEYVDHFHSDDYNFESYGVRIFIDQKTLIHIDGTEIDFIDDGLNKKFRFNNPNVKHVCGCGDSFYI